MITGRGVFKSERETLTMLSILFHCVLWVGITLIGTTLLVLGIYHSDILQWLTYPFIIIGLNAVGIGVLGYRSFIDG